MVSKVGRPKLIETRSIDKRIQLSIEQLDACNKKSKATGSRSINSFLHDNVMAFCFKLSNKKLGLRDKLRREKSSTEAYKTFIAQIINASGSKRQTSDKLTQNKLDKKDQRDQKRIDKLSLRLTYNEPKDELAIEKSRNQRQIASRREKKERILKSGEPIQIPVVRDD